MSKKRLITRRERGVYIAVSVIFLLYAATLLYPYLYALLCSLNEKEAFLTDYVSLPKSLHFENYLLAFSKMTLFGTSLLGMFGNSIIFTVLSTVLSVAMCSSTAYCISKYRFRGRGILYSIAIFIMIIPTVGSMPASYRLVGALGFMDNVFLVPILYASGFGLNFLLLYGFMQSVSWSYAEAGFVDGCTDFGIFFRIMLPQLRPALVAVGIVTAISVWNDYMTPFLYLEHTPTLAYGLYYFNKDIQFTYDFPTLFAGILLSCIPLILVFCLFQKTIIENTVAGGLKG